MAGFRTGASLIALALLTQSLATPAWAGRVDSPQFRGPARDGHYAETNLLPSWPEGGPKQLWSVEGLGEGFAGLSVADGQVFVAGMKDAKGTVFAYTLDGKKTWATEYGAEHDGKGYPGTRTTPTYDGGQLFVLSALGSAVALDAKTGAIQWHVDVLETFGGENTYFGMAESPLVDGDRVIITAGGKDATLVALDRKTGKTVWRTKGLSDSSAYCSPRIMEHGGHRQIVTLVEKHLVGVDPSDGKVLWRQNVPVEYDIHANSPVFHDDLIYVSHGYGQGGKAFRLAADGTGVTPAWTEEKLDVHHGGAVVVGDHIYGAADKKNWHALDVNTGAIAATIPRLGKGAIVYADGMLYGYTEGGDVVLVNPDPAKFEVVSQFEITAGEGHHWAHPVLAQGRMFIRHGDVLMAFDVARGE